MFTILLIFLGLVLLSILVVVHEWGHMATAKKFGAEVEEFGVGFPPRAKVIGKKAETTYTLNWLPLGGFVKIKGESDDARGKGTFGALKLWQKAVILLAGVVMNWLTAAVIFTIVALLGMPQFIENQYHVAGDAKISQGTVFAADIAKGSPAEQAGIKKEDKIISLNDQNILMADTVIRLTKKNAGQEVAILIERDGKTEEKLVKLNDNPGGSGNLGVTVGQEKITTVKSTWSAPIVGIGTTVQFTYETFKGVIGAIGNLFAGNAKQAGEAVAGPVGIFSIFTQMFSLGPIFVFFLLGIISVSLAVMNTIPIPALDGGRLFVIALFRLIKKPLTKDLEEKIHGTGMLVLLAFVALITVVDILRAAGKF